MHLLWSFSSVYCGRATVVLLGIEMQAGLDMDVVEQRPEMLVAARMGRRAAAAGRGRNCACVSHSAAAAVRSTADRPGLSFPDPGLRVPRSPHAHGTRKRKEPRTH